MLASIHPLGERARGNKWGLTAASYVAGSLAGGAAIGAFLGALRAPVLHRTAALAVLCLAAAAADVWSWPLPTPHRQVNEDWLHRYRGWVYGVGFGFQLGLGVVTIVTTAAVYLWLAAALLSASWVAGLAIGATFGLVRALPLVGLSGVDGPARLRLAHKRFQGWSGAAHRATATGMGLAAVAAAAMAAAGGGLRWPG